MKKVLSVLLSAAMVMGMSVSAFATNYTWGASNKDTGYTANDIEFANYLLVNGVRPEEEGKALENLEPGDDLYFPIIMAHECTDECCVNNKDGHVKDGVHNTQYCKFECVDEAYTEVIDRDWSINIYGDKYVVKASFVGEDLTTSTADEEGAKYVKVELVDELDATATVKVDFNMYIADNSNDSKTNKVTVEAAILGNHEEKYVQWVEENTNDADEVATWIVAKNDKGTAIFDFEDDVYFTVKMVSEEKVTLNLSQAYDKAIDKAYNEYDADLSFYNFKGTKDAFTKTGELFIPAAEETFIYEVVDGELVEIDATWTDEYDLDGTTKEFEGWVIKTKELGYYVVADEELVVAEVETEVEAPVEAEKANPETGAADFVGAAVAMAVVSVAAAGALALKK